MSNCARSVVDPWDLMEDACPVYPAPGHQKVEMRVEVDPLAEGLDGGADPRRERVTYVVDEFILDIA